MERIQFFESYYENELISICDMNFKVIINNYPDVLSIYRYIGKELDLLNQLRSEFMSNYKYAISFHPYYTTYDNIKHPDVSLYRRKKKYLDSRYCISIASKSKAILISFEDTNFMHTPEILKDKQVLIKTLDEFLNIKSKLFNTNKPTKNESLPIINEIIVLNQKLEKIKKEEIPFTLIANEINWSHAFFTIRDLRE